MQFRTRLKNNICRPIIPVRVHINGLSVLTDALIDTGADVTIMPKFVADRLGIDLSNAPESSLIGALGGGGSYRVFELELELRELPNSIRWKAPVGFTNREMSFAFPGTRGFFEFFELTYNAKRELIDLKFNEEVTSDLERDASPPVE